MVLKRLTSIAARATSEMQAVLEGVSGHSMFESSCWERFFKPALSGFDAAFVLRRTALPFPKQALFPSKRMYKRMRAQFENEMSVVDEDEEETLSRSIKLAKLPPKLLHKGPDKAREALLIGFDPVSCFIKDAEKRLGGTALLFVDKYGGDTIGVAFKPDAVHASKPRFRIPCLGYPPRSTLSRGRHRRARHPRRRRVRRKSPHDVAPSRERTTLKRHATAPTPDPSHNHQHALTETPFPLNASRPHSLRIDSSGVSREADPTVLSI